VLGDIINDLRTDRRGGKVKVRATYRRPGVKELTAGKRKDSNSLSRVAGEENCTSTGEHESVRGGRVRITCQVKI